MWAGWHAYRRSTGSDHVYQGRFKSFPVEADEHFYTVARYVERNAARANLVRRAEGWRWGSLYRWLCGSADDQRLLSAWPLADDRKPELPVVATEFVGTSICSGGNGKDLPEDMKQVLAENPFVHFHNQQRGYVRCALTPNEWRTDFRVVEDVTRLGTPIKARASFVIETGKAGAQQA